MTDYLKDIGFPGQFPFTRGVHPTMYRGRLWTMRQYAGFGTAEETNKRFKYLLEHGQTGLSVAFDLPTQMGYDSDHPMVRGEVGRVGVAIDSIEEMETLFDGIPLDRVSTSMTINATAPILLALYLAVADKQKIPWTKLRGTVQNDILKEYIARGTYIYPVAPSIRLVTDLIRFCRDEVPNWNAISVSGYHMREAGCTAVQEIAFTLANGVAYLEAAISAMSKETRPEGPLRGRLRRALPAEGATRAPVIDDIAGQVSFFFGVHNEILPEIAKFRAARRLWARIVKGRFKARKDESCKLRFHSQTAGCALTAQQPKNNIVRVTLQALAAVLGGAQSLHTNSFDEALAIPAEDSARLALRTQQIIAFESGVVNTIDPVGGAYAIEALTDELEKEALALMDEVEKRGGMVAAIETGFVQREIQESAYRHQKDVEEKRKIIVGTNEFVQEGEEKPSLQKIDPAIEKKKRDALRAFRARRDRGKVEKALHRLEEGAKGEENVVPLIYEAVQGRATVGEISETLRGVFGVFKEKVVV